MAPSPPPAMLSLMPSCSAIPPTAPRPASTSGAVNSLMVPSTRSSVEVGSTGGGTGVGVGWGSGSVEAVVCAGSPSVGVDDSVPVVAGVSTPVV